jgi:hypothetical protein
VENSTGFSRISDNPAKAIISDSTSIHWLKLVAIHKTDRQHKLLWRFPIKL